MSGLIISGVVVSEKDYLSKMVNLLQTLAGTVFVFIAGLVAYVFNNYEKLNNTRIFLLVITFAGLVTGLLFITKILVEYLRKIRRIE